MTPYLLLTQLPLNSYKFSHFLEVLYDSIILNFQYICLSHLMRVSMHDTHQLSQHNQFDDVYAINYFVSTLNN